MTDAPKWAVQRAVLGTAIPPAAKLVMLVMLDKSCGALELKQHSPSIVSLMDQTGYPRDTVTRYLPLLKEHGWLTGSSKAGRKTWYTLAEGKPFAKPSRYQSDSRTTKQSDQQTSNVADQSDCRTSTSPTVGLHQSDQQTTTSPTVGLHTHHSPIDHLVHRAAPAGAASAAHRFELRSDEAEEHKHRDGIRMNGPAPWDEDSLPAPDPAPPAQTPEYDSPAPGEDFDSLSTATYPDPYDFGSLADTV